MDRQQEIADHRHQRDVEPHIGARADRADHQQRADRVDAVVEEIAIGGPLDSPPARKAAIERIAEPVDDISDQRKREPFALDPAQHIAGRDEHRARETERSELVGRDPMGQAGTDPVEQAAFAAREDILLDAGRHGGRRGRRHESLSSPLSQKCQRDVIALS